MLLTQQEFTSGGRPQGGTIPEDLRDFVENVSPVDRPALALFGKSRVATTYVEWLEDTLAARGHNAYVEGVDATDVDLTTPSRLFNHVQLFAKWGKVSDTQRQVEHKGFADALRYQEMKKIDEILNDVEHTVQRGSAASGETDVARQMKGLLNISLTFMSDHSGVTLTEDVFIDLVQQFTDGSTDVMPRVALVNSWLKRTISQYSTKITRNVDAAAKIQYATIERHTSDFGDINVVYTRDQLKSSTKTGVGNSIVILDPAFFEVGFLQSLQSEILARSGLSTQFQIQTSCTLIFRTAKAGGGASNVASYIT